MPPLIHTFSVLGRKYVFDANVNATISVSDENWELAKQIEHGEKSLEADALLSKYNEQGYFLSPNIKEIKNPQIDTHGIELNRRLGKLTLQVTQKCNLRCSYCVYSGMYNNRTHSLKSMNFDTAKRAIDYVLNRSVDINELSFGFYGGEPLLELELIEKCIAYVKSVVAGKKVIFTITTNGTLLTTDVYERLEKHDVSIAISIDGPQVVHDSARKYANGNGSYDDIMRNVLDIRKKYPESTDKLRFMAVLHPGVDTSCVPKLFSTDDILSRYKISMSFVSEQNTNERIVFSSELLDMYKLEWTKVFLFLLGKLKRDKVSPFLISGIPQIFMKYEQLRKMNPLPEVLHPGGPCLAGV